MVITTEQMGPPDRGFRWFLGNQTPWSRTVLGAGIAVLVFHIIGTIAVLTSYGWTQVCPEGVTRLECSPSDPLADGLTSDSLGTVAWIAVYASLLVVIAAFATWKRMPNKPAREAVITGGTLAIQAAALAGILLWFRGTDVPRFARNFLNLSLIGQRAGVAWDAFVDSLGTILLTGLVVTIGVVLATNAVRAVQRGKSALLLYPIYLGALVGFGWGLIAALDTFDDVSSVLQMHEMLTFFVGLVLRGLVKALIVGLGGLAVGVAVAGAYGLVDARRARSFRPTIYATLIGAGLGTLWGILDIASVPSFVKGAQNTLILSGAGAALGFALGLVLALFTMSKRSAVRAPARVYINFFRGTPLIWQISFAGIGFVPALRLDLSMYTIAILVLGLNLAAYSAEVYRAGIQSLERGQIEASRTLGLSYFQSMRYVIVPQAIRRVIPPLLNEFVILIKDTSLVSVLGLTIAQKELLGIGRDIYSSSFDATAWLGAAAGYLIITLPLIGIVTMVERRLRSGLTSVIG